MERSSDPDLVLIDGVCNHCRRYDTLLATRIVPPEQRDARLSQAVETMKKHGAGREYDCLIGVSGGVDSTYVAMKVKELGLRPLAVHVDNGWNSEIANSNIEKLLGSLDIDLKTIVLEPEEFRDLQRAFLQASTPDADIPTDHAIQATLWHEAKAHGIRFIISGMNFATESISVKSWSYGHSDWRYIKDVHRKHGRRRLRNYPHYGLRHLFWITFVRRIRIMSILNYLDYNKEEAVQQLQQRLDWQPYEGKHFESIFTRWAHGYLLPAKFNIDKRRGHLSNLINSGQLTRDEALAELVSESYPDALRRTDQELIGQKLSLSEDELSAIMAAPPRTYAAYRNSYGLVQAARRLVNALRKRGWYPR